MELPSEVARCLEAAQGYLDLGMPAEAWDELARLGGAAAGHTTVRLARIDIRMRQADWASALQLSEDLIRSEPAQLGAYISRSFCLHCLHRTLDARDRLLEAPAAIEHVPTYHYNLACYEAQLGHRDVARRCLVQALHMHGAFRDLAAVDPDLRSLRGELEELAQEAMDQPVDPQSVDVAYWCEQVAHGPKKDREAALQHLIQAKAEPALIDLLASQDPLTVELATRGLWDCWMGEEGDDSREVLASGVKAMQSGAHEHAEIVFRELVRCHPAWAEPLNKLATLYYMKGAFAESLDLCRKVVSLKPHHFGAWSRLAMCATTLERWADALDAVREAIRLQPHSAANQKILENILDRLP
jgi:tetratricopeptide (TPR) repeat protein